ncbi:GTP cyclohydrolase II [Cohnella fermenti]|uniref:GTP cyclohydrolase II n=1 Tax=Cohnella fermenti TaxID=2565925 RepID=A0A4S4BFA1_9BACL|nr:GTP cyclohydrolase II [Cohnella fermenti]THF72986.1 GTP cyclohydrolase II [Cohnella fermenti]
MISNDIKQLLLDKMTLLDNPGHRKLVLVGPVKLPIQMEDRVAEFQWYTWLELKDGDATKESVLDSLPAMNLADLQQSSVLVYGDFANSREALVRMHSICHTGDIFGSKRCDCGYQLRQSLRMIVEHGSGALFYLAHHEGRGIGLFSKSLAYILQQEGLDTVEANEALGFQDDIRSYEQPIRVLKSLRSRPVTLITNNPRKLASLRQSGLAAAGHLPLWGDISDYNRFYLATKVAKSGHIPQESRAMA